jgi:uncharacterized membrane protein YphA (DoxX/SURF4 family)
MTTRTRVHAYFASLAVFALAMLGSGIADVLQPASFQAAMRHLGYPAYVATLLGVWKLLGVLAIVAPGRARLKEWAYAGFTFDLSGAFVSHLVSGDELGKALVPLLLLGIGLVSWATRTPGRRLPGVA